MLSLTLTPKPNNLREKFGKSWKKWKKEKGSRQGKSQTEKQWH